MKLNICPLLAVVLISARIGDAQSSLLPAVDISQICEGVFFEARPLPENDQFFIGCVRGGGFILQCFENEIFDRNSLRCVYNEAPTTVPIATTSTPEFPGYDGVCDGKFFNFIEHPTDCGKAIFCFEESPIIRECQVGQIFDVNTGRCQNGNRQTCEFYGDLDGICDGLSFNFVAHPNDCALAIFCFEENPIIRECSPGEIFDIRVERCRAGDRETCTVSRRFSSFKQNALLPDSIDMMKLYRGASEQ